MCKPHQAISSQSVPQLAGVPYFGVALVWVLPVPLQAALLL